MKDTASEEILWSYTVIIEAWCDHLVQILKCLLCKGQVCLNTLLGVARHGVLIALDSLLRT